MREEERIVNEVAAALEQEPSIDLHRYPVLLEFAEGALTMEGEMEHIMAKKRALEVAAAVSGVSGIVDRLRLAPAVRMGDGDIRDHVCTALLAENLLSSCAVRAIVKGNAEVVRGGEGDGGSIDVEVNDGVVVLNGRVPSLSAKRLAGVLAWWVPGSRDVVNGIEVSPFEEDNDDEVVDAVRLVLEKDPFVNASQVRVTCRNYTVTLEGVVKSGSERQMAEADCWYLFRVDRVTNLLQVGT
ncbi:MAG TPA: BON domain-containing protein [Geobacteraceae bacterium]|nr:BON domain-containing protein [Geobacteraceae bacterium]